MSCLEAFKNRPVMIQVKNPILAVVSASEEELENGEKCGNATMAFITDNSTGKSQPIVLQTIRGSIEFIDESHMVVATVGGDNKVLVRMCLELSNVGNVTFCVDHVEVSPPAPSIIMPGVG